MNVLSPGAMGWQAGLRRFLTILLFTALVAVVDAIMPSLRTFFAEQPQYALIGTLVLYPLVEGLSKTLRETLRRKGQIP